MENRRQEDRTFGGSLTPSEYVDALKALDLHTRLLVFRMNVPQDWFDHLLYEAAENEFIAYLLAFVGSDIGHYVVVYKCSIRRKLYVFDSLNVTKRWAEDLGRSITLVLDAPVQHMLSDMCGEFTLLYLQLSHVLLHRKKPMTVHEAIFTVAKYFSQQFEAFDIERRNDIWMDMWAVQHSVGHFSRTKKTRDFLLLTCDRNWQSRFVTFADHLVRNVSL